MGAACAKQGAKKPNPYADRYIGSQKQYYQQRQQVQSDASKVVVAPPTVEEAIEQAPRLSARYAGLNDDEFYDGIPRYRRSPSRKSRSLRGSKGSDSFSSRTSSAGFERAAGVLDALGNSMTRLNSGFGSGSTTKGHELCILSFEVANTIVKGSTLMKSLSKRSIRQVKEVVFPSEGVQNLISQDLEEFLRIIAADTREELKVFSGEVVRFGNRCKDPQWHNLDRYFEKRSRDRTPIEQLREAAEAVMEQLMNSVQLTAELYEELHALDKFEQEYQGKRLEARLSSAQRGNGLATFAAELKSQQKLVKNLKKKSLWSRSMEEVMGKLVDVVLFLNREINNTFGSSDDNAVSKEFSSNRQRSGLAGLSLHYANIILQIDSLVDRSSSMPPNIRDMLYQNLPPSIKSTLRTNLQSFHVEKELTVPEIKDEMEKTLHWLVPIAINTAKAHHGFGWVGEWGNTGSQSSRSSSGSFHVMQIETLHHADTQKTEAYILDLVLWLNYLVSRSKPCSRNAGDVKLSIKSSSCSPLQRNDEQPNPEFNISASPNLYTKDHDLPQDADSSQPQEFGKIQEIACQ